MSTYAEPEPECTGERVLQQLSLLQMNAAGAVNELFIYMPWGQSRGYHIGAAWCPLDLPLKAKF